jgi:hypothetical protein
MLSPSQASSVLARKAVNVSTEPLPAALLSTALNAAKECASAKIDENPSGLELFERYRALGHAQVDALAILQEAQSAIAETNQNRDYKPVCDQARATLRALGKAYGEQVKVFAAKVHGDSAWPTLTEMGPSGARRYINSFKSKTPLSAQERQEIFAGKLAKFAARGGEFETDILLPKSSDEFQSGLRYDYCFLEDGTLRAAPRGETDPDPGHAILAEGGSVFRDTRVAMAGELQIVRDDHGEVIAALVACNSGHFKPFAEDLPRMIPAMAALGISSEKVIFIGGPNNSRSIMPEIAKAFDLGDRSAALPPTIQARRKALRTAFQSQAMKPWQRA